MSGHESNLSESVTISQRLVPYLRNLGFKHIASEVVIQSKGRNFRPDVVVYRGPDKSEPYIVAELKMTLPTKMTWLDPPVQQAFTHATALGEQVRYLLVTDGYKHHWFEISREERSLIQLHTPPKEPAQFIQPALFETPLTQVTDPDQFLQLMRSVLDAILSEVRVPGIEAATDLNKILIAKLHDERTADKGSDLRFHSQALPKEVAIANVKLLYDEAMAHLGQPRLNESRWSISSSKLLSAMRILEPYALSEVSTSVIGTLFWRIFPGLLLRSSSSSTTPFPLGEVMVQLGRPAKGDRILDPVCGTGLFLIEAYHYLEERITAQQHGSLQGLQEELDAAKRSVFGIEINHTIAELASTNMALNSLPPNHVFAGSALDIHMFELLSIELGSFDLVLMDPPVGRMKPSQLLEDGFETASMPGPLRLEILFIEQAIRLLRPGGRLVTLVPDSLLFASTPSRREARRWLLDNTVPRAIISLPPGALAQAGHHGKASILLLEKIARSIGVSGTMLVADVQSVGYDERGRPQPDNALPTLVEMINEFLDYGTVTAPLSEEEIRVWLADVRDLGAERLDIMALDPERETLTRQLQHGQYPTKKLKNLAAISSGRNFKQYVQERDNTAIVIQAGAVRELRLDLEGVPYISEDDFQNASRSKVEPGDVLVTTTGHYLGRAAVFEEKTGQAVASGAITIIRPHSTATLDPYFLAVVLNSSVGREQIEHRKASSTAQPYIRRSDLGEILIPVPPLNKQREIADRSRSMLQEARQLQRQARQLESQAMDAIVSEILGNDSDE